MTMNENASLNKYSECTLYIDFWFFVSASSTTHLIRSSSPQSYLSKIKHFNLPLWVDAIGKAPPY